MRGWVRLAAPVAGIALFLLIFPMVGGLAGLILGLCAFIAASAFGERFWRRGASPEEIRQDLEHRTRTPPS